ncbi:MAG: dockerin type I domain-containing protein, partial [Candidatus Poribacteria bacterium]|nr:dockerin type I domain-containing protein [Candidatus Poribacteria bacterium]
IPRSAPYVNGTFMETIDGYSYTGLAEIESTLLWSEQNFREPQINCLEGRPLPDNRGPLDSPRNQQWMRLFTTMSLTHSDGYVLFVQGGQRHPHRHYWYPFWDADLGRPVGGDETKAQLYENHEGLFIREFTNGWAVYNRSGNAQEISLPIQTTGVESGVTSFKHTLPDLDGEMFLKTEVTADVNGDGVVNIQDLVIVANAFGKAEPDLNGDGVVNIQDLVIVANAF